VEISACTLHLLLAKTEHGTRIVLYLWVVFDLPEQALLKGGDFASAEKTDYVSYTAGFFYIYSQSRLTPAADDQRRSTFCAFMERNLPSDTRHLHSHIERSLISDIFLRYLVLDLNLLSYTWISVPK